MKTFALLLSLSLFACPRTPTPVQPVPATCEMSEADHDSLADTIATDLQDDSWEALLTALAASQGDEKIDCVVREVLYDTREAPTVTSRGQKWLSRK